jgi:hypothetical protein
VGQHREPQRLASRPRIQHLRPSTSVRPSFSASFTLSFLSQLPAHRSPFIPSFLPSLSSTVLVSQLRRSRRPRPSLFGLPRRALYLARYSSPKGPRHAVPVRLISLPSPHLPLTSLLSSLPLVGKPELIERLSLLSLLLLKWLATTSSRSDSLCHL